MKKIFIAFFMVISICAQAQIDKVIPPRPTPPRLVNDFANILTPEQEQSLEQKLVAYDDSTSTQIAVVTIETLQDYPIEDVALQILRQWGVGGKEKDNGAVILVAMKDKKIRIETGYGLEGAVPDITARQIIESDIAPNFRNENYYRAFDAATTSIMKAAAGEYQAPEGYGKRKGSGGGISFGKIILAFIILMVIMGMFGGGNRGGGFMSRRGYRRFGGPVIFPGSFGGGGWSGGGGGWSGGGGGGGFGGFGGGGGGGGGASGGW
ncbi:TPM domain-containing protein [Chitinophagaceae bacterium LB-8]|uniref:TPM domain-containing protein n=1 Tax=Paraflavisolibacter caeni TaxID=2982496 RepID=A0A9X2XQ14_9BACT|nr:TPM domain-containing protein [Paraflavisolibacter caeni]MCU7552718.1 TPM domain-containing protein [Paraflavisolibacter caeni]